MDLSELERLEQQNEVADVLRRAKALIATPERWSNCGGGDGKSKWCLITALNYTLTGKSYEIYCCGGARKAYDFLHESVPDKNIPAFNNAPNRTHAEVLQAFDRAIALAEQA